MYGLKRGCYFPWVNTYVKEVLGNRPVSSQKALLSGNLEGWYFHRGLWGKSEIVILSGHLVH